MLGTHGKNLCYNLDVYWMTQTCGDGKNITSRPTCIYSYVLVHNT